jgi:hypothetical protein
VREGEDMTLSEQATKAFKEFVSNMHGIAPNRLLMNAETAKRFKDEMLIQCLYMDPHPLLGEKVFFHGMRLVEDANAVGIEVAYAR